MAGATLYAANNHKTRPLIICWCILARYISKWNFEHYKAAKHLLRYIRGTSDLCLTFDVDAGKQIVLGYADADWGGDLDTRVMTSMSRQQFRYPPLSFDDICQKRNCRVGHYHFPPLHGLLLNPHTIL
jgi:hypothetical protein